ncbi:MAG: A/G-specific adenine glycosylase [Lewinellaceae bacterium]|nr:A/G-specific adenine glycosylase [Saprospiraceae bacterium]MCB9337900.1 A/G-specific adenine glycosylase [Lewinellaceae bacterium]
MEGKADRKTFFTQALLQWHTTHHRPLPWKGEKDPYLIWLSEIILQQTRVEQGLPYFEKFKAKYPTVKYLAAAPEDEVMKMWEGLGYYSRARNMHAAAKYIAHELAGVFPKKYEGIRALKGVGDYTAAAIAAFAFDLPHAVVDGNVYRVLSRYFGVEEPVDTTAGKKQFAHLAQELLDVRQPGRFNQAIMDFGAGQCTPAAPKCASCPLQPNCSAFHQNKVDSLPVKSKKLERRQRFFNYLVINQQGNVFIKKRTEKDIWRNLYDFPLIETDRLVEGKNGLEGNAIWQAWLGSSNYQLLQVSPPFRQELTHQQIVARFWEIEVDGSFKAGEASWVKCGRQNLQDFAFPKVIVLYLKEKSLPLELF